MSVRKVDSRRIASSVLIIGSGGSGLRAAIELVENGVDVLVVSKRPKNDAHTSLAAGGINAALATVLCTSKYMQSFSICAMLKYHYKSIPRYLRVVADVASLWVYRVK